MKELINWYYELQIDHLEQLNDVYYTKLSDRYIYIISVGKEKNTIFFHLLQYLQYSTEQQILLSKENTTTVLFEEQHYYVLQSTVILHEFVDIRTLQIPTIYPDPSALATELKERWIAKNRLHEEQLNVLINHLSSNHDRLLFFDLATYYIHLNEQAYTFINELIDVKYPVSLCHMRLTPTTYKFECFCPKLLTLDNKSRCYCEYIRHLYLMNHDLVQVQSFVKIINQVNPLSKEEWSLLYARLFFPTQFYDALFGLRQENETVNIARMYEQALDYAKLLYQLPYEVYHSKSIELRVPEWVKKEAFSKN